MAAYGDTIDSFWGAFLMQPIPLELSFNWCSHNCAYCFANLNKPNRKADLATTNRILENYQNRKTLVPKLLQQGYGVLISNRVDPFATSNYKQSIPVMQRMTELGIPIAIQTKGGKGIDEALTFLKPAAWYISITMLNDETRQRIEPGAPTINSRFELIEKLVAAGHSVFIGLNPWAEEWCSLPEAKELLDRAKQCGAWGVWTETLHFSSRQRANMPPRAKAAIGEAVIKRVSRRKYDPTEFDHWLQLQDLIRDRGLEAYSMNQGEYSRYFDPYKKLYKKSFETLQGFINHCFDSKWESRLISFQDWCDFMLPHLPSETLRIDGYLRSSAYWVCQKMGSDKASGWKYEMTYKELFQTIWQERRFIGSPVKSPAFAYAQRNGQPLLDSEGLPLLTFSPTGFDDFAIEV